MQPSNVVRMDDKRDKGGSHMDDVEDKHWRLDRRISIGSLWTIGIGIIVLIATVSVALYEVNAMQKQFVAHEEVEREHRMEIIAQHQRDIARMERVDSAQYTEIIRRLELLQAQLNEFNRGSNR